MLFWSWSSVEWRLHIKMVGKQCLNSNWRNTLHKYLPYCKWKPFWVDQINCFLLKCWTLKSHPEIPAIVPATVEHWVTSEEKYVHLTLFTSWISKLGHLKSQYYIQWFNSLCSLKCNSYSEYVFITPMSNVVVPYWLSQLTRVITAMTKKLKPSKEKITFWQDKVKRIPGMAMNRGYLTAHVRKIYW